MKKILVPTDFSAEAQHAFDIATQLAHLSGAELKLLNVIEMNGTPNFAATGDYMGSGGVEQLYMVKLLESTRDQMRRMMNSNQFSDVRILDEVDVDDIFHNIRKKITQESIDLVVMGTKGADGLNEMLIGSNTEKVVRQAHCPVLTVKANSGPFDVRTIVFPSNFREDSPYPVDVLKYFQKLFNAHVHLVYINTPTTFGTSRESKARMEDFVRRYNLENYTLNIHNDSVEEDGILSFADEVNADLIIMATHGRTGFSHLLSGSIAEDMVNHAQRPILTCHMK
ncbi:universal stress protein [Adhaeribacter soli]|uniref:Universal stress protein n=1 Tax=Adhaeribacter soli TaxID=2607655 RepID=A0A5N1IWW9_9BACT|nr:universal stress protein [Adhaeribacter soli]KAA9338820.1 universal stress protein [Adhaeribacter soli]